MDRFAGQPGIRSAQLRGHPRMAHGEALDVQLVDDRVLVPVRPGGRVGPLERPAGHQAARHERRGVRGTRRVGPRGGVAEHLRAAADRPRQRPGVRVEQQLGRVAAQAASRVVGAGHPVPVRLAGRHPGHEPVPHAGVVVQQRNPGLRPRLIEQAQHDLVGHAGGHREVGAAPAGRGAERVRRPGPRRRRAGHRRPRAANSPPRTVAALPFADVRPPPVPLGSASPEPVSPACRSPLPGPAPPPPASPSADRSPA